MKPIIMIMGYYLSKIFLILTECIFIFILISFISTFSLILVLNRNKVSNLAHVHHSIHIDNGSMQTTLLCERQEMEFKAFERQVS